MAIELVNLGNTSNDGTGDDLRTAFEKVNDNFTYLDGVAEQTGVNLGTTGPTVFKSLENNVFFFRRLIAGENIAITENSNTLEIANTQPESRFTVVGDSGSLTAGAGIGLNIVGAESITVGVDNNSKTITITGRLENETTPALGANLLARGNDISDVGILGSTEIFTTDLHITGNINDVPYHNRLGQYINGLDMGSIEPVIKSRLDHLMFQQVIDFGTFEDSGLLEADLGTLPPIS